MIGDLTKFLSGKGRDQLGLREDGPEKKNLWNKGP
jgi:hypothetical protein